MILELNDESLAKLAEAFNAPENPVTYLGIDPGKANGVCGYDAKYHVLFMYTVKAEDMANFLNIFKRVDTCVVENYVLYPTKAREQVYSDMETSRVIGRIEYWATRAGVNVVKQLATIKKIGYLWLGKKPLPKSNELNHQMDAHVHFMYWAVKNGRIPANRLLENDGA